jgi:hypothetical protein
MRHLPGGFGLVLQRRFEFDTRRMAVITETGLVAHTTDRFLLVSLLPMGLAPASGVVETGKRQVLTSGIVAVGAGGRCFTKVILG